MDPGVLQVLKNASSRSNLRLKDHEVYVVLESIGIKVPNHRYFKLSEQEALKNYLSPAKLYRLKADVLDATTKQKNTLIAKNICSENIQEQINEFIQRFDDLEGFLVTEQLSYETTGPSNGQFLVSVYRDMFFGPQICLGLSGTNTEEFERNFTFSVLQEINFDDFKDSVVYKCMSGKIGGIKHASDDDIMKLFQIMQKIVCTPPETDFPFIVQQIEINPIVVQCDKDAQLTHFIALDAFIQLQPMDRKTWDQKVQLLYDHKNIQHLRRLKYLFAPSTIAIAGVSTKNPRNPGNVILDKIKGFYKTTDNISIIHPRENEYNGIKCYKNIQDLHDKPDLYIIATNAEQAAKQLLESCENDVSQAIFIISAGFDETVAGKHYVDQLRNHVRQRGIVEFPLINGPNTLGYFYRNFTTTFTSDLRSSAPEKHEFGDFALITQSGACLLESRSALGKIQPKFALSVGNQIDLSVVDTLQWFLDAENEENEEENESNERLCQLQKDRRSTRVFGLYIEGLKEGEGNRLVMLVRRAVKQKKLVIIYKAGRTKAGQVSVSGHTASVAGSYQQFKQNISNAGACVVETYTEFLSLLQTSYLTHSHFTHLGEQKKNYYISALTNAGFQKCQVGDLLFQTQKQAAQVVQFDEKMQKQLEDFFTKHGIGKIVDVCRILDVTPMLGQDGLIDLAKLLINSDAVDILLVTLLPECESLSLLSAQHCNDPTDSCEFNEKGLVKQLIKIQNSIDKPIIVSVSSGYKYQKTRQLLIDAGIPAFEQIGDAAVCIRHLTNMWAKCNSA